jgi:ATP-dependent Clp protease adaptor protein ClpS
MAATETIDSIDTVTKVVMRPPRQFDVILYNDDRTTIEFVILVLMNIFQKSFKDANALTRLIHDKGQGVAGTYSLEIANQKCEDTITTARINGFQLRCDIQEN